MRSIFRGLAVIAMVSFTSNTPASSPTFVIDQIYSSADGVVCPIARCSGVPKPV